MQRYIAFAWDHRVAERSCFASRIAGRLRSTLPHWKCALSEEGLQVYHTGDRANSSKVYLLDQNTGVVVGKVFERCLDIPSDAREAVFNPDETLKIRQSNGRHLVERYWGRYVALLREEDGKRVRILRDPTGAIPCLLINCFHVSVVCSHVADCATLGLLTPRINWQHIAAYLWFDDVVARHTGLDGVRQVLAGECVTIDPNSHNRITGTFYWSPDRIHDTRTVDDRRQAIRELRRTIQYSVSAWASCYSTILHRLSGGLDSAIVLAALSRSLHGQTVVCENHYTLGTTGDERAFARNAAASAGVELVEISLGCPTRSLSSLFDPTKVATPTHTNLLPQSQSTTEALVKARGIEAVFSGQGGDHYFQRIKTPLIAAEYAWRHGLRPALLDVVADTSRFTRIPVWSVMLVALTSGIFHRYRDPYDQLKPPPLVSDATWGAVDPDYIRHPWIDNAKHLPGSKLLQAFNIIDSQHFYRVPHNDTDIVHPLISQPIIELCLQIPCYLLTYGGIDRALVRDAFTGAVPPAILERTSKGCTTGYVNALLVGNLSFLREYLLDGVLISEGLLDRRKTDVSLTESALIRNADLIFPVLNALRAEYWLKGWIGDDQWVAG